MQPNPDPKPGRWILPVVIVAMMGFAALFINAADGPTTSPSETTSPGGGGTTTSTTTGDATGTTVPALAADVVAYNAAITNAGLAMAGLQERVTKANSDWDARTVAFAETLSTLQGLDTEIQAWRAAMDGIVTPTSFSEYEGFHAIMKAAATEVSRISGTIVPALRAPDTGEARRAAVAAFNVAVTEYGTQVNSIAAYIPGANP